MRILARVHDEGLQRRIQEAAAGLDAEIVDAGAMDAARIGEIVTDGSDVVVIEDGAGADDLDRLRTDADRVGAALVLVQPHAQRNGEERLAIAEEWVPADADVDDLALRLRTAVQRAKTKVAWRQGSDAAELFRYEEMLYDNRTRLPTVATMIDRARQILRSRGEMTVTYIHFAWYPKIEEIYGWQKLDAVLRTTADAIGDYFAEARPVDRSFTMMTYAGDDDFVLFSELTIPADQAERWHESLTSDLEAHLSRALEDAHGAEIANLCDVCAGTATVASDPKLRTERLVYRGIREAAMSASRAARGERTERLADLQATLREGSVFMEYHPIVVAATGEIYGYEALARGTRRDLRSPEVLFEVADEANLVWELSRLLRRRAVDGIIDRLEDGQLLFLNVDPHDFADPQFRDLDAETLGVDDPGRVVFEITERVAIRDYPRFQALLAAFRERGFRFAVDDAGSGYAGLGSIANLAPDFIKLDLTLITDIGRNFLKQNLVQTLVSFAEEHGAKVVAEGVETREEYETIQRIGVHLAQGFYFHRPNHTGLRKTS